MRKKNYTSDSKRGRASRSPLDITRVKKVSNGVALTIQSGKSESTVYLTKLPTLSSSTTKG